MTPLIRNLNPTAKPLPWLSWASTLALVLGTLGQAKADIVVPGSTFGIDLVGLGDCVQVSPTLTECNGPSATPTITVGAGVQNFTLTTYDSGIGPVSAINVAATESEIDLGGGNYQLDVDLSASTPIFPIPTGALGIDDIGIGETGPALDLSAPVTLTSLVIEYLGGSFRTGEVTSGNLAGTQFPNNPWNGVFNVALDSADALVATGIEFQMQVSTIQSTNPTNPSPVPEPATVPLLVAGLGLILLLKRPRHRVASRGVS